MKYDYLLQPVAQGLLKGSPATVSVASFERLCCALIVANHQIAALADTLHEEFGSTLEFLGAPYPTAAPGGKVEPGTDTLIELMEQLQSYAGPCKVLP